MIRQISHFYTEHHLTRLRETIKLLKYVTSPAKNEVATEAVENFVTASLQTGMSRQHILAQLEKLHKEELLISSDLYKQAQELAAPEYSDVAVPVSTQREATDAKATDTGTKPLFCKDTVYHAGICSLAVTSCTAGDYQKFFKDREKVPGHAFQEISISRSKQDRYLIARQGDSTYYFTFQSEPSLLEWPKQFKSFYEGTSLVVNTCSYVLLTTLLHVQGYRSKVRGFLFVSLWSS